MIYILIQVILFQFVSLIIYDLLLKRETFHNYNRLYLLLTSILSITLPFVKLDALATVIPAQYIVQLPVTFIGERKAITTSSLGSTPMGIESANLDWSWIDVYYIGLAIALFVLIIKVFHLVNLYSKSKSVKKDGLNFIEINQSNEAFSFFNIIFLGKGISESDRPSIINHELVHVKQGHTYDLIWFEILKLVFWFNPLPYLYQIRIRELHEYIADNQALSENNKSDYYQNLLRQIFKTNDVSFVNQFHRESLINKRITMLNKSNSKRVTLLKYILIIPFLAAMTLYNSCYKDDSITTETSLESSDHQFKYEQMQKMINLHAEGASLLDIEAQSIPPANKYISSKEEYYRFMMYSEFQKFLSMDSNMKFTDSSLENALANTESRSSYSKYLGWKETEEAKQIWKNTLSRNSLKEELLRHNLLATDDSDGINRKFIKTQPVQASSENVDRGIEVPYAVIEEVPTFYGCDIDLPNVERKACTSSMISRFVNLNFNTNIAKEFNISGRQRINVIFKIDANGNVINIRSRGGHPELEKEAARVIGMLPKFTPGKQKGIDVVVPYSLPIVFQVQD